MRAILLYALIVLSIACCVLFAAFDDPLLLLEKNWFVVPIAFFAAALANATAVGGGFVFVPLFIYGYGLPAITALKLSLATQAFGMTAGAVGWNHELFDMRALVVGGVSSVMGLVIGTLVFTIPGDLVKPIFGWVALIIFAAVVLEIRFSTLTRGERIQLADSRLAGFSVVCVIGGFMTAWTGIAIGEFAAVYLLFVYRLRIETAIATGVALLAINSIAGAGIHLYLGGIPWHYLIFTAPGVLLGGYYGAVVGKSLEAYAARQPRLIGTIGQSPIKVVFAAIILIDGSSILLHYYFFT